RTNFLAAVVCSPEADERAVAEGEIHAVFRTHAEAPQAIAPHFSDPVPVLGAIQHANRGAPAGAGGEVIANGMVVIGGGEIAKHRGLIDGVHPLFSRHKRDTADIIQRFELFRVKTGFIKLASMEWGVGISPLAHTAKLEEL